MALKSITVQHPPEGFRYRQRVIPPAQEGSLVDCIKALPLREFEFQGYLGKRRVTSFGWRYDFGDYKLQQAEPIPDFLQPLRRTAAEFAGLNSEQFVHVLVTEYRAGTTIGWHRDRDVFGDVVGISLLSRCIFRFRRRTREAWQRHSLLLDSRSMYLLRGEAREQWEHSIPPVD
ncbi:MAG: alpha-ketoglutarate-dependent dioxygenase AlkB, partial [Acidobacteria bacterium]|nr:alpha-ketoglutarate-dependent dioxygenase AlkB [Acidobacteriota bacterium]